MIRTLTQKQKTELIEKLADIEHKQWIPWSENISRNEKITEERYLRWRRLWVSYEELTEEQKEQDRVWARKVLQIFEELNLEVLSK